MLQEGSFAPDGAQASSELVLSSQLRAQVRVGILLQASDLLLVMTSSLRYEAAHSRQARKTGQLPQPLASLLASVLDSMHTPPAPHTSVPPAHISL